MMNVDAVPSGTSLALNRWEVQALNYEFPTQATSGGDHGDEAVAATWRQLQDPIIYPGIYSATGFDMMSILLQVISRPNPQIELGAIDCSVALTLCDLAQPDSPIVYVSDSFCELTGYSRSEVLGQNCRFLQSPPGSSKSSKHASSSSKSADKSSVKKIRKAVQTGSEIQIGLTNYKKNGSSFTNMLSIVPLPVDTSGHHYAVGFLSAD